MLLEAQQLRQRCAPRRDWPITGFTHSVHARAVPAWVLPLVLGDTRPWDALICTSTAGRTVIEHYLDTLAEAYPRLAGVPSRPRPRLPVIPLGTDAIAPDPERRARVRRRLGLADEDVLVLYLGRLSAVTKCDLVPLLAAFSGLAPKARARTRLLLAGDDTQHHMAEGLRTIARSMACANVIIHPDPARPERDDFYHAADLFTSPSGRHSRVRGAVGRARGAGEAGDGRGPQSPGFPSPRDDRPR
jgi:glycosyltransferase involved in cell wall biosynthesis